MRRYLLDTNALSDALNKRRGVEARRRAAIRAGHRVGTCPPVLGEYYYGLERSESREANRDQIRSALPQLVIWPFDHEAAKMFGRLAAELRRLGRPMQQVDIQLAAVAFALGNTTVVSSDSDLLAVPGLVVENWAAS